MRKNWTETTLGEIAEVNMGQSPPGDTYNTEGIGMPFMQGSAEFGEHYPEPVKFCSAPAKIAEIGDLLLSVRAPVGDSNFANQRIAIGRGLATVRARTGADTHFLRLVIQLNTAGLLATSGTGMFSSITGKNLREFGVNLPPLLEQKRIVDVVSSVDVYIDALQHQAETARTARKAVLHELLSAGGEDWTESTLGDIAKCAGGTAFPHEFQGGDTGTPFVKVSDMNESGNERFLASANNHVSKEAIKSLGARVWPKGTIVFAKVGAALLTEKRRILVKDTIFDNNIMGLVPKASIESHFLYLFMETVKLGDYVQPGAVPSVNNSIVSAIAINLPPLTEQKRVVDVVSSMDEVIQSTEKAVVDAKKLRSGLLSGLLSGEHEIPASYDSLSGAA